MENQDNYCAVCGILLVKKPTEHPQQFKNRITCSRKCGIVKSQQTRKENEAAGIKPKKREQPKKDTTATDNLKRAGDMLKSLRASLRG